MTASLSIRQVIEAGPKMPSTDPAARARTVSRAVSRSLSETKCAPFETNGDRFSPHVCAFYRNSASKSPPNVVACGISSRSEHGGLAFHHSRSRARWGEALAEQTARATEEISQQVSGMQDATGKSVAAITDISGTISRMSEIATVVSAAEQQHPSPYAGKRRGRLRPGGAAVAGNARERSPHPAGRAGHR